MTVRKLHPAVLAWLEVATAITEKRVRGVEIPPALEAEYATAARAVRADSAACWNLNLVIEACLAANRRLAELDGRSVASMEMERELRKAAKEGEAR